MLFKLNEKFSQTFVVTDKVYTGFIEIFNDNNPLHTNGSFAISKGFSGCVMHGNILNGFISYFIGKCLPDENVIINTQEILFKKPVYLHDELLFEATITGIFDSVNTVEFKFTFKNQFDNIVAKGKIQISILK